MSKKKLVDKALQAAMEARAAKYVADPLERDINLGKFLQGTKTVNDEGDLFKLYHITSGDFSEFIPGGPNPKRSGPATWLSANPNFLPASHSVGYPGEYVEGTNVMPLWARMRNPLVVDKGFSDQSYGSGFPFAISPEGREKLIAEGYDSVINRARPRGEEEYIVLHPNEQLKSATGNSGLFDPNIPRIDENRGGAVDGSHYADGGEVYQSTGEKLIGEEGKINWGDPNEARDFFRADAEMMRRRRAEEEAARKIDREAITVSSLPAPGSEEQPSAPVPIGAARQSDISPYAVLPLIRQAESSDDPLAQSRTSTAGGLYQFTDETWASALRRMDPERYGRMTTAQLAALKKGTASVPIQEQAARFHLEKDILPTLEGAKIPVNPATIYLSWFQGPQGAVAAYNAPGSAMVKDLFPKTVGPNERLQYRGKPYAEWTRDDLVNWANETMTRRMRGRAEGGRAPENYAERLIGGGSSLLKEGAELPKGETFLSAPEQMSLVQRAMHVLPSFSTYGRAIREETNAPREAMSVARELYEKAPDAKMDAAKLAALGALGYAISPITAAQNVLIRDPILKAGGPMDLAERGVTASDMLGLTGAMKAGAKKVMQKSVVDPAARGSGAGSQAQLLGTGYLVSPGRPEELEREERAVGGMAGSGLGKALELAREATGIEPTTFIGERAFMGRALDKQLGKALKRLRAGEDPERVRRLHGWSPDPGGALTYEMSDKSAKLRPEGLEKFRRGETVTLGDLLDHPALFEAYPPSFSRPVQSLDPEVVGKNLRGTYDEKRDILGARRDLDERSLLNTLLHENQHRIQTVEGMSPGQNASKFVGPETDALRQSALETINAAYLYNWAKENAPHMSFDDARALYMKQQPKGWLTSGDDSFMPVDEMAFRNLQESKLTLPDLYTKYENLFNEIEQREREIPTAYEQYYRSLGEVSARKPGERLEMSDFERRRAAPFTPQDEIIVRPPSEGRRLPNERNLDWDIFKLSNEEPAMTREPFERGGKKIAKSVKDATAQARKVFPELATRYPEVAPPVEAIDPKSGKPYLAKTLSEEAKALQLARKIAQERIDRGEYTPFFDPAKRYDVDPSQYPAYEPTITQRRVKPETQEKYDTMLMAEDVLERLNDAYKRGMLQKEDAQNWYMLGQVEAEFIKEFGEKVGREKFKERIADAMAATTGGADPESNWLMAQYGNVMKEKGLPMPTAAYEFPFPIGGRYVTGNMDQYRKMIMEGQGVTPENPKRYNFAYNFLGSKAPTIDEQMMGIIRPGVNVPEPGTYGHHEAPVTAAAAREGVEPRYFQEVAWAGAKDAKTKGGFKAAPFIDTINESIERTSQVTGMSPDEVVRRGLVRSEIPMYGVVGAAGTSALMPPSEEEPKAKGGSVVSKALVLTSKKAKR